MRRTGRAGAHRALCFALTLVGLALPGAVAAQPAWIEGEVRIVPPPGGKGMFVVDGWAVASCDAIDLTLTVDGKPLVTGHPYLRWGGIRERFPSLKSAEFAGFSVPLDPGGIGTGVHQAVVTARACGIEKVMVRSALEVLPPTSAWIAWPLLVLLLVAVPLALGAALLRVRPVAFQSRGTLWAVGLGWLLAFVVIVASRRFAPPEIPIEPGLFSPLANWDGRSYVAIAHEGYSEAKSRSFVYFPLLPLVLRGLSRVPVPVALSSSLLNGVFLLLAVAGLRRLSPERDQAILIYAFLPFAFFFCAVYTEAIFLFLSVFFLMSTRREKGLLAAAFGALAALTRVNGVLLAVFAIEPLVLGKRRIALAAAAGPAAGLALWMLRLRWKTGDPLHFLHSQTAFGRSSTFHPALLLDRITGTFRMGSANALGFWELGFLLLVLAGAAGLILERRWAEGLFSAGVVLLPLYTQSITSMNRYALAAFPAFLFLGERVRPRVLAVLLPVEAGLLVYFASRFGRQIFVG